MWLLWALGLLLGSALYNLARSISATTSNYRAAKKMGLPVVVSPVNSRNVFWLLTQKYLAPIICAAPFGLGSWARFTIRGWLWENHEKMYQNLGKVWVQASPKGLDVSEAPGTIQSHFKRSLSKRNITVYKARANESIQLTWNIRRCTRLIQTLLAKFTRGERISTGVLKSSPVYRIYSKGVFPLSLGQTGSATAASQHTLSMSRT